MLLLILIIPKSGHEVNQKWDTSLSCSTPAEPCRMENDKCAEVNEWHDTTMMSLSGKWRVWWGESKLVIKCRTLTGWKHKMQQCSAVLVLSLSQLDKCFCSGHSFLFHEGWLEDYVSNTCIRKRLRYTLTRFQTSRNVRTMHEQSVDPIFKPKHNMRCFFQRKNGKYPLSLSSYALHNEGKSIQNYLIHRDTFWSTTGQAWYGRNSFVYAYSYTVIHDQEVL